MLIGDVKIAPITPKPTATIRKQAVIDTRLVVIDFLICLSKLRRDSITRFSLSNRIEISRISDHPYHCLS
jgi:hypothetical protein